MSWLPGKDAKKPSEAPRPEAPKEDIKQAVNA
jgi:hypothetical protein